LDLQCRHQTDTLRGAYGAQHQADHGPSGDEAEAKESHHGQHRYQDGQRQGAHLREAQKEEEEHRKGATD